MTAVKTLSPNILSQLKESNIVVLGLGITGLSCVRFLHAQNIQCTVNDSREQPLNQEQKQTFENDYPSVTVVTGDWDAALINAADIILVSPGIDLRRLAQSINTTIDRLKQAGCQIWGDVELYCRLTTTPILAVTGSNGKSTVVSLLAHIGQEMGLNAVLGGNVGIPVLDHLSKESTGNNSREIDFLILELSSFQLESLTSMQAIATTVLNVSDDHRDRHLTMENYQKIKNSIYRQGNYAVINRDDQLTHTCHEQIISFGSNEPQGNNFGIKVINNEQYLVFGEQKLMAISELPLAGLHNALNFLSALALGHSAQWPLTEMVKHFHSFEGLEHRCQTVNSDDGIIWVNDSKATNVGATLAAIEGIAATKNANSQMILIAGGEGKGADFSPLAPAIKQHVSYVITLGKDGEEIGKLAQNNIKVDNLQEGVNKARDLASKKDIVLLSPACASIDMFKNFVERGQVFMQCITASQDKNRIVNLEDKNTFNV
jgi:UDP-N-acetylmuramoylalanine--D-glutamate ligase